MDEFEFPVEIVRTSRKRSASIELHGVGVRVRVPRSLSDSQIKDLISKKSSWIKKKIREAEVSAPVRPREYVSGEAFPYLGQNYRLKVISGDALSVKLKGGYLEAVVPTSGKNRERVVQALLAVWYQTHALIRLEEKTNRYAKIIEVSPKSVNVENYKSRWGSCSVNGDITYNWRIILAPHRIVDYVVVHELCHLLEHNHSSRYWQHVNQYLPDYKARRAWLKAEGASSLAI